MNIQEKVKDKEMSAGIGKRPVRMLQYGEGNFLRAFVDWMVDIANEKGVTDIGIAIVKPRPGGSKVIGSLRSQEGLYTVMLEGMENGRPSRINRIVSSVRDAFTADDAEALERYLKSPELRFVVSNTTEAGIRYQEEDILEAPSTFPGKLAKALWQRYLHFEGDRSKGLIILPCELIEDNGAVLKEYLLRHAATLGCPDFVEWINDACVFANTLVDRIVAGRPENIEQVQGELGYADDLIVKGELYHVWAIGGLDVDKIREELPLDHAGLNVKFLPGIKEFRERKVRILNGSHTGMVALSLLMGHQTVDQAFSDDRIRRFVREMISEEVIPALPGDRGEIEAYAEEIFERFENPYLRHRLESIAMNSLSKWESRILGSVVDYNRLTGRLPKRLLYSLAALLALYSPESGFTPSDSEIAIEHIRRHWNVGDLRASVRAILSDRDVFTNDFEALAPGISDVVAGMVKDILQGGCLK